MVTANETTRAAEGSQSDIAIVAGLASQLSGAFASTGYPLASRAERSPKERPGEGGAAFLARF